MKHRKRLLLISPGSFTLRLKDLKENFRIVSLQKSEITFSGNPYAPSLDIHGKVKIENVDIAMRLEGTIKDPVLTLASEPPMSQEMLLVMLATGKSWKGTEEALVKGQLTPGLAADVIDYFLFAGSGDKLAQRLGIREISVTYDEQAKGVEVRKAISPKVEASYGVGQTTAVEGQTTTTHKVGTGLKVTDAISVEGERKVSQPQPKADTTASQPPPEDRILLKYKKRF